MPNQSIHIKIATYLIYIQITSNSSMNFRFTAYFTLASILINLLIDFGNQLSKKGANH